MAKREKILLLLSFVLLLGLLPTPARAAAGDSADDPITISTAEELAAFRDAVNAGETYEGKYFKVTADIDLSTVCGADIGGSAVSWTPIGNDSTPFKGAFDGGGHTIRGLYINAPDSDHQGLFGYLGEGGTVESLGVVDGTVTGGTNVGGLCGENYGTIKNCRNTCEIAASAWVGGVCGFNWDTGMIETCYNTGAINGNLAGGICGMNVAGAIIRCYNTGAVSGSSNGLGGVCGFNGGSITNCYNTGAVSGDGAVGGVSGYNHGSTTTCYNIGAVSGSGTVGGVCGEINYDGQAADCYYLAADGLTDSSATAKTTAEFASGEVAYLLQGDQLEQVWGQSVGSDHPELTADAGKRVYQVVFTVDDAPYAVRRGNAAGLLAALPDEPEKSGYAFGGWRLAGTTTPFTAQTPISSDMEVSATWAHVHSWAAAWSVDETHHWHECEAEGCDVTENSQKDSYGEHDYADDQDTTCDACGYTRTVTPVAPDPVEPDPVEPDPAPSSTRPHYTVVQTKPAEETNAACPKDETCPIAQFTDADPAAWYHDGVHYCVEQGLMVGTSETTFAPAMTTSRAMIATILWRQAGSPVVNYALQYEDVEQGAWYTEAVRWATSAGVVSGYGNGTFGPNDPITREQLAAMLWRYAGEPETAGTLDTFPDRNTVSDWAKPALHWATETGVVTGKSGDALDPQGQATRAEAASMLQRYLAK